jgi:hypothetical protein
MAEARAREALERIALGQPLKRTEPRVAYDGAEGVPIREEIIRRAGETVITRNSYGALCLNTPNVLFVDIDLPEGPDPVMWCCLVLGGWIGAGVLGWWFDSLKWAFVAAFFILLFSGAVAHILHALAFRFAGDPVQRMQKKVQQFLQDRPDWYLRLYRTPAGFRILVLHRTFDPLESSVAECFQDFQADPRYARMCRNQRCFRARVSPKPWRIGIEDHVRPRRRAWPIDPSRYPERTEWIARYDEAAKDFASCRLIDAYGSGVVHSSAQAVMKLHDELCRAERDLPIA